MRGMIIGAIGFALVLGVLLALIWAGQRRMMYFPFGTPPTPDEAARLGAETVTFTTPDGLTLAGWFVPAPRRPARFTALVFNGNAGDRSFRAALAMAFRRHDIAVLLFDYRGFGGNPGSPTETGLENDARAARAYLESRGDVDASRIIYFGESLGTAVATNLAAEQTPAALVLRSPFRSMADIGAFHYPLLPVRWLLRDRYDVRETIATVRCPVLVIAGERDRIVPLDESRALFERAPEPKQLVVIGGADHNDEALVSGREMIDAITSLLASVSTRGSR